MALPSFFKHKSPPASMPPLADPPADEAGPVQLARVRARRRLIGAVLLLAIGVVVFPMLFETQPRPLPRDIPIELPRREGVPVRQPMAPRNLPAVTELPVVEPASPASAVVAVVEAPPPSAAQAPAETSKLESPKAPEPPPSEPRKGEADRARAALEARADAPVAASDAKAGRFVVQVGAYTDATSLRDVRAKVEKLGLKTYTQSVDTDAGKRTRVRVGPFATRPEAEAASNKLKAAGLPGNVLVL